MIISPQEIGAGPKPLDLRLPSASPLVMAEELELAEKAFSSDTATVKQRRRLAHLLLSMDRADHALVILDEGRLGDDFETLMMQAEVHLARRTASDDARAHGILGRAAVLADTAERKGWALAELARAEIHRRDWAAARKTLRQALGHAPLNVDAFRRLALLMIKEGVPREALEMADGMLAAAAHPTWALAIRAAALAASGDSEGAKLALGLDRFAKSGTLPSPVGWRSLADFNNTLASELEGHPGRRYERYGTAAVASWRIDEPLLRGRTPIFAQFLTELRDIVLDYVRGLDGTDHPFLRFRPLVAELRAWAVIASPDGHEGWHIHPDGWLSGVYYVDVPPSVVSANALGGCLEFAVHPDNDGIAADPSFHRIFRPSAGLYMLFPSCNYHRTFPLGEVKRRICVAFDVVPITTTSGEG